MRLLWVALLAVPLFACGGLDAPPFEGAADAGVPSDGSLRALDAARVDAGPPPEDLEGFVDWQMRAGGIRGLAAAITTPDAEALTLLRGEASEGVPVSEDTLFTLASVSKTFTAITVLQLADEGLLDLDAPLDEHLPYAVRHPDFAQTPVTARMLLTHTSGLSDDFIALSRASDSDSDPTLALADFARDYVRDVDHWGAEPGTDYAYSNAGFALLGALVEAVSGDDFRARSERSLLEPLGLESAGWFLADIDRAQLATPYSWSERGGFTPVAHTGDAFYPASSLRASVRDVARYARAVASDLELDGVRVLSEARVAEMREVPFPETASDRAHGWEIEHVNGHRYLHHSGVALGWSARLYVGDDGVGLVVLTNSDASLRARFGQREGADALRAIVERLDREADSLAR